MKSFLGYAPQGQDPEFHSLQDSLLSPLEVAPFANDCETPPQRGRGNNTNIYHQSDGEGYAARYTFYESWLLVS